MKKNTILLTLFILLTCGFASEKEFILDWYEVGFETGKGVYIEIQGIDPNDNFLYYKNTSPAFFSLIYGTIKKAKAYMGNWTPWYTYSKTKSTPNDGAQQTGYKVWDYVKYHNIFYKILITFNDADKKIQGISLSEKCFRRLYIYNVYPKYSWDLQKDDPGWETAQNHTIINGAKHPDLTRTFLNTSAGIQMNIEHKNNASFNINKNDNPELFSLLFQEYENIEQIKTGILYQKTVQSWSEADGFLSYKRDSRNSYLYPSIMPKLNLINQSSKKGIRRYADDVFIFFSKSCSISEID
jgi:hypothetical protein